MDRATADGHHPAGRRSDYNLLLVSRLKEEIPAGLNTGIIRAWRVRPGVTAAGLIFAATMASMVVSDLVVIGQFGTAIGMAYSSTRLSCEPS